MREELYLTKNGHKPKSKRETNYMASTYQSRYLSNSKIDPKLSLLELFNQIRGAVPLCSDKEGGY